LGKGTGALLEQESQLTGLNSGNIGKQTHHFFKVVLIPLHLVDKRHGDVVSASSTSNEKRKSNADQEMKRGQIRTVSV